MQLNGYTENSISKTKDEIAKLRNEISKSSNIDDDKANKKINDILDKWDEYHKNLAYFIEHNELEKVETSFTASRSLVQLHEYKLAMIELDKIVFILNHINDKYSFSLENIF